jgi:type I restriction enzyme, S subunit
MSSSKHWKTVRLGDVAKTSSGGTPKRGVSEYYGGDILWVKSGELGDGMVYEVQETITQAGLDNSSAKLFPKGTLCIALYGATIGKLGILGIEATTNQAVCGIFLTDDIDTKYVFYFLESIRKDLIEQGKGGAQPNINQGIIRDIQLPIPETLDEQRRIVSEIEKQFTRLDAGVEGLKRVQANLKRYRASVLKAACSGELVPTEASLARGQKSEDRGRQGFETGAELLERILAERRKAHEEQQKTAKRKSKYKEPAAPDTKDFPDLPEGWVWTGFEQISSGEKNAIKAGPFGSALKKSYYTPSGYKIYGQEQVINGNPYYGDYFISEDRYESLKSCVVKSGDILISLVGTTGRVLILPKDCAPGIINPRLLKLSLNHRGVNAKYIQVLLAAPQTKAFFKIEAHGGTMDVLNLTILKSLPIPLPPLAEQKRIVEEVERRLSVVEEMEAVVEANLKRAACLRQSILKKAFEGELV